MRKVTIAFLVSLFILAVLNGGCQRYNPEETLKVEKAIVKVYYSPDPHTPLYEWYKDKTPDPDKHRNIMYETVLVNDGRRVKNFVLIEPVWEPLLEKMVVNDTVGLPASIFPGEKASLDRTWYLMEGDPKEIERLVYQSKLRIVWEEGGKKWEKIISVEPEK
ncbi:MAG: hypothetical protein C4589_04565 [Peptococcaceae bacterium]|nr:MAG: hypothetical protein C4589_04565 [Peptococcaceae bacterium]